MILPQDADLFRVPVAEGVSVHVARYGYGGNAVVLVHGFGTSSFLWRQVGPLLAVQNASAYAIDLLGYGESDRPYDADFGLAAQAQVLESALAGLQLEKVTLVGVDIGALVALRLAYDRPHRVHRLVMVGPPPLDDLAGTEIRDLQLDTAKYALRVSRGLFAALALLRPYLEDSVADKANMPEALVGRYLAPYIGRDGANHLLTLAGALSEEDFEDLDLRRIDSRALIIRGTRDRWCTPKVAQSYANAFPFGHYEHVDEVGHLVPEEGAHQLTSLILAFARTAENNGTIETERSSQQTRSLGERKL